MLQQIHTSREDASSGNALQFSATRLQREMCTNPKSKHDWARDTELSLLNEWQII